MGSPRILAMAPVVVVETPMDNNRDKDRTRAVADRERVVVARGQEVAVKAQEVDDEMGSL
jgi:hypothetical protein